MKCLSGAHVAATASKSLPELIGPSQDIKEAAADPPTTPVVENPSKLNPGTTADLTAIVPAATPTTSLLLSAIAHAAGRALRDTVAAALQVAEQVPSKAAAVLRDVQPHAA